MIRIHKRSFSRTIILVLLFMNSVSLVINAQSFSVKRQSVNMKIEKGYFLVSGMYFITGIPGGSSFITIPFPNGTFYGAIDSLHVYDVSKADFIPAAQLDKKFVRFAIEFDDTGEYLLQVYYRLRLLGNKAEYPFNLDLFENEKIEKACFYLIAPSDMNASRFNYTPKDTIDAGENIVYYWEMYDFAPIENFEFRFK